MNHCVSRAIQRRDTMQRTLRMQPMLAALAAILAGCTLAASAIAVGGSGSIPAMPGEGCPPTC
jgi:hypothetical protein